MVEGLSVKECIGFDRLNINPFTGKKIRPGGPTARNLAKECLDHYHPELKPYAHAKTQSYYPKQMIPMKSRQAIRETCAKYNANPLKSPFSGRKIKPNGPLATKLKLTCTELEREKDLVDYLLFLGLR